MFGLGFGARVAVSELLQAERNSDTEADKATAKQTAERLWMVVKVRIGRF
jgi:hypothetical protein